MTRSGFSSLASKTQKSGFTTLSTNKLLKRVDTQHTIKSIITAQPAGTYKRHIHDLNTKIDKMQSENSNLIVAKTQQLHKYKQQEIFMEKLNNEIVEVKKNNEFVNNEETKRLYSQIDILNEETELVKNRITSLVSTNIQYENEIKTYKEKRDVQTTSIVNNQLIEKTIQIENITQQSNMQLDTINALHGDINMYRDKSVKYESSIYDYQNQTRTLISELVRYEKMTRLIKKIHGYSLLLARGYFENLTGVWNDAKIDEMGTLLSSDFMYSTSQDEIDNFSEFGTMHANGTSFIGRGLNDTKDFMFSVMRAITSGLRENREKFASKRIIDELTHYGDVLNNAQLLKAWVDNHYGGFGTIVDTQRQIRTQFDLKPEYKLYFEIYGVPEGGTFNVEKMITVKKQLGMI